MVQPILDYSEIIYDPWQNYNFSKEFNRRFSRVLGEGTILDRDSFRIDVLSQEEKTILLHKGFCFKDKMFIQICDTEINLTEVLVDAEDDDMVLILLDYTYARKLEPNRASLRIIKKSEGHPITFFNNFILVGCLTYRNGVLTPIYDDVIFIDLVGYIPITNITELSLIGVDPNYPLDGHYYLANDIDASQTRMWNWAGEYETWEGYGALRRIYDFLGWIPIGITDWYVDEYVYQTQEPDTGRSLSAWFENAFTGILDGCGHTIYNLYSTCNSTGLFFATDGAIIRNLNLVNSYFHSRNYALHPVGGFSARSKDTRFEQLYVSGNLRGGRCGGIVSHFYFVNNTPTEYSHYFENCHNDANISSARGSGGVLAQTCDYTQSHIPAVEDFYLMKNCFSTGIIDSVIDVNDGLGAREWSINSNSNVYIDNCYHNSYYSNGLGGISTYREDDYLRQMATFLNWDFVDIWAIEEDISYPYFIWRNLRSITRTYSFDLSDDRINGGVVNFSGWKDDWDE